MSTYLVAFVVSDFVSIQTKTSSNKPIKVWARADIIQAGNVALKVAAKIIDHYEKFYDLAFPLPKQDLVAIPDFAAGAMENWGLITYRETFLMYDEASGTAENLLLTNFVVTHELAHQWFGNIVTMRWWDGLWLNEGFASYIENVGTDYLHPEWRIWSMYVSHTQMNALNLDSSEASHPVLNPVNSPDEIYALFDQISYLKGSSIIRMMNTFLGEKVFLDGLQAYLKKHQYANTDTSDLWNSMSEAVKKAGLDLNIAKIMDTWTLQMGYPVLTLTEEADGVHVTQKRYLQNRNAPASAYVGYVWDIPVSYHYQHGSGAGSVSQSWLWSDSKEIVLSYNPKNQGYIKLNSNQANYYRVNYSPENWKRLEAALSAGDPNLSESDRAGLLEDSFSLANAGFFPLVQALRMSSFLLHENSDNFAVWDVALQKFQNIRKLLVHQPQYNLFEKYMQDLLVTPLNQAGWTNTGSVTTKSSRAILTKAGVMFNVPGAKETALSLFNTFYPNASQNTISSELRACVYTAGLEELGELAWNFLYDKYTTALDANEKLSYLNALATSNDVTLLQRTLEYAIDPSRIRPQDMDLTMILVARNPLGQELAWNFLKANYAVIFANLPSWNFAFFITGMLEDFQTQAKYDEIQQFFSGRDVGSAVSALQQVLETIQFNIQWTTENYNPVIQWLASR